MNTMRITSIIPFLCLLCGCQSSSQPFKEEFTDLTLYDIPTVYAEKAYCPIDSLRTMGLTDVRILSDSLVTVSRQFGDHLVSVFNGRTGEVTADLLHMGRGPGEAINAYYIDLSEDGRQFWTKDMGLNVINVFNADSVLNGSVMPSERIALNDIIGPEMSYLLTDSAIYSCPMMSDGGGRFSRYSRDGSLDCLFGDFPDLSSTKNVDGHALPEIFSTNFCPDYTNHRLITADGFISLITIYSFDGSVISNIWGPETVFPSFSIRNEESEAVSFGTVGWDNPTETYFCVRSYGGFIFALYRGMFEKWKNGAVIVLNPDSEPIMAVALPEKINRFDIDPDKGIIYGINGNFDLCKFQYNTNLSNS